LRYIWRRPAKKSQVNATLRHIQPQAAASQPSLTRKFLAAPHCLSDASSTPCGEIISAWAN